MIRKNSKIFIAGHKGLVGSAIYRKLKEIGYTNLIIADGYNEFKFIHTYFYLYIIYK